MKRLRWTLWGLVALFGGLMALFALQLSRPKDEFVESTMIGKPVPQFALPPRCPTGPACRAKT